MSLPRGFKASAERESHRLRGESGLDAQPSARRHRARQPHGRRDHQRWPLIDVARLEELERIQAYSFSAATFAHLKGTRSSSPARCVTPDAWRATYAHELSHLLLRHELSEVRETAACPSAPADPTRKSRPRTSAARCCCPPAACRRRQERPRAPADRRQVRRDHRDGTLPLQLHRRQEPSTASRHRVARQGMFMWEAGMSESLP